MTVIKKRNTKNIFIENHEFNVKKLIPLKRFTIFELDDKFGKIDIEPRPKLSL